MRLKASKKPAKRLVSWFNVYDVDTDEFTQVWLTIPHALNCPILRTCAECGKCRGILNE